MKNLKQIVLSSYCHRITVFACLVTVAVHCFKPSFERTINSVSKEGHIAVYDKALPEWLTSVTESSLFLGSRWLYQHPDQLANVTQREEGNLDWSAPISPDFFMKSKLWIVFKKILADFTGQNGFVPYQVKGLMLRRGDSPTLIKGEPTSDDVIARVFLTKGNVSNCEMVFTDENGEILQAIKKKFNRIVIWNASLDYYMKQPGFQTFKTEYSLLIKMSRDLEKMKEEMQYVQVIRDIEKKQELDNFPMYGERGPQYNNEFFEKHLTRKFYDKAGGVIGMFDGILNETELATLRRYLSQHNTAYSNSGFTTREDDDSDNVSWIAMFLPEAVNNTKILDLIKGMARYLSGEDGWYPYDVSLNMIQKTFHTRIHSDCEDYEHEYTFLLYLNPNWTTEMYGETIFLEQVQDMVVSKKGKVTKDKAYETIVSVMPKYGRMVMFRNYIPHSARPPSPSFHGSRYTFAVKVSRSKVIGLSKILRELLESKSDAQDEGGLLYSALNQMAETSSYSLPEEKLLENIRKYRKTVRADKAASSTKVLNQLLRKLHLGDNQPTI